MRVTFTGRVRLLEGKKREVAVWAARSLYEAPEPEGLFRREVEVRAGNAVAWVAIQEMLVPPFQREVQRGSELEAYVVGIGVVTTQSGADYVLLMNEFRSLS